MSKDYFKEQYFYELSRRDRLNSELALPFGMVVTMFGASAALTDNLDATNSVSNYCLLFALLISIIGLLFTACLLSICWSDNSYDYPAYSENIKNHKDALEAYYDKKVASNSEMTENDQFLAFLNEEYIRCSTKNARLNDNRSQHLNKSKKAILVSAFFLLIGFITNEFSTYKSQFQYNASKLKKEIDMSKKPTSDNKPPPPPIGETPNTPPPPPPGRTVKDFPKKPLPKL